MVHALKTFLFRRRQGSDTSTTAYIVRAQLTEVVLATFIFLLVIVIPFLQEIRSPEADNSMRSWAHWVDSPAKDLLKNETEFFKAKFDQRLVQLRKFYRGLNYGPFAVCFRRAPGDGSDYTCSYRPVRWMPSFDAPERQASILHVQAEAVIVSFSMAEAMILDAGMMILTIVAAILVLCAYGLKSNNRITQILVVPLERMLDTLRRSGQECSMMGEHGGEDDLDAIQHYNPGNEFDLLERSICRMADMQMLRDASLRDWLVTQDVTDTEFVTDFFGNGTGSHNLTHKCTIFLNSRGTTEMGSNTFTSRMLRMPTLCTLPEFCQKTMRFSDLDAFGAELSHSHNANEKLCWEFDVLDLSQEETMVFCANIITSYHGSDHIIPFVCPEKLTRFTSTIASEYKPNPYHNWFHGVDVMHSTLQLMRSTVCNTFLLEIQQFALLIAALAHDVGHPGWNNAFLVDAEHELALRYNDRSCLENMHCASLYDLLAKEQTNIVVGFSKDDRKAMRAVCINTILHTDMVHHFSLVQELVKIYELHFSVFGNAKQERAELYDIAVVLDTEDHRDVMMKMILHCADISNAAHDWTLCKKWAYFVLDEFFAQGDQEKARGIAVQMLNDREKVNQPASQISFIEFMVVPMFVPVVNLFPQLHVLVDNLALNSEKWAEIWEEQSTPSAEEVDKMYSRVQKITEKCSEAYVRRARKKTKPRDHSATGRFFRGCMSLFTVHSAHTAVSRERPSSE